MEVFEKLKIDGYNYGYFKTYKLKNNQTASIFFIREIYSKCTEYHIVFAISNKKKYIKQWLLDKKDVLSDKITGTCGLEGLIWAKNEIISFENFIKEREQSIVICIGWEDNRRRNVYERALSKYGYKISYRHNSKYLSKKIA